MASPVSADAAVAPVPVILRAYVSFAIVASIVCLVELFATRLNDFLFPYTGATSLWVYPFTLAFAVPAIRGGPRRRVFNVAVLLAVAMIFGFLDTYRHNSGPGAGQSGLAGDSMYNPVRPVFTITLPAIWLFLLISPMMKKWVRDA
jgi:hypothetical protein